MVKVEGLTNNLQSDRLYLPLTIPSAFGRSGRIVSCNRIQTGVPAHQVFCKLLNHFMCRRVAGRHDPRVRIECSYNLLSISSNPMTPDPIILFELLVQLREFALIDAQPLTAVSHLNPLVPVHCPYAHRYTAAGSET